MPIANQQGTGKKPETKAEKTQHEKVSAANSAEVERSVNEWRALQGLPPRDMSKEARNG